MSFSAVTGRKKNMRGVAYGKKRKAHVYIEIWRSKFGGYGASACMKRGGSERHRGATPRCGQSYQAKTATKAVRGALTNLIRNLK